MRTLRVGRARCMTTPITPIEKARDAITRIDGGSLIPSSGVVARAGGRVQDTLGRLRKRVCDG